MTPARVKVQYFGLLRNVVGYEEEFINVPSEGCLEDVLRLLVQKHGEQFGSLVFRADGSLRPAVMVVADGVDVRDVNGLKTKLEDKHEIFLAVGIYPIVGG